MTQQTAYESAGVNIDAGEHFVQLIRDRIRAAWPETAQEIGGFAGRFAFKKASLGGMAGTDGSGTVAILCALTKRWKMLGQNAAAMSVVDAYVAGARVVGLLDVLDVAKLDPETHIAIIDGLIEGCKLAGPQCRLIGGETAELPDMFAHPWMVNINTTAIGEVHEYFSEFPRDVVPGQRVFGWPSNGFGSNGFSLVRKVFDLRGDPTDALRKMEGKCPGLDIPLVDALLQPTPIWIPEIEKEIRRGRVFQAHAHITGGGLVDNIPRVLPQNVKVVLDRSMWVRPPIFSITQDVGRIEDEEMDRVFNQGLMMVSILANESADPTCKLCQNIGTVMERSGNEPQVQFIGKFQS